MRFLLRIVYHLIQFYFYFHHLGVEDEVAVNSKTQYALRCMDRNIPRYFNFMVLSTFYHRFVRPVYNSLLSSKQWFLVLLPSQTFRGNYSDFIIHIKFTCFINIDIKNTRKNFVAFFKRKISVSNKG